MNFFRKIRFKWYMLTKGPGYISDTLERMYKIYLNHNKVIHFRDGYPVYSISTPALFSKPMANFFSRLIYGVLQNRTFPNLMSFAVNDVCNFRCQHCSFFTSVDNKAKKVLNLQQAKQVIKEAQDFGVSIISFTGGEPLMREDIEDIIKSVDKSLSTTNLFTNGSLLKEKALGLKKAGLDGVYVSIDYADKYKHDQRRGVEGAFDRAIEGLKEAKRVGLSVGIACCIFKDDFENGELTKLIELGKNIGVHEILVFPAAPSGKLKNDKSLIGDIGWIDVLIKATEKCNNDLSYPGILVYGYTSSHKALGCSGGVRYVYVSPYGDISPCDFNHAIFGNILEEPLYKIWDRMSSEDIFKHSEWSCKLRNPVYRKEKFEKLVKP